MSWWCNAGVLVLCRPQLAAVMWIMTYVGAVFNGITILIIGKLALICLMDRGALGR